MSNYENKNYWFKTIMFQYLFAIGAVVSLIVEQHPQWLLASFIAWFLFYVVGEGIFLHRYFSHNAFKCKPWVAKCGAILSVFGAFSTPIPYRIAHVLHHAYSDTKRDPHSPLNGFWNSFSGWAINPSFRANDLAISKRLLTDKFYVKLELNSVRIWWAYIIIFALIDWHLVLFLCLGSSIGMLFTSITNSFGHYAGSRRFDTNDNSRNFAWFSWICWQGSGALQNNHHAYPSRKHDSFVWYEFDIGKYIIPMLEKI